MGAGLAPKGDYTELSQLASRIAAHLTKNPGDRQARDDLRYVVTQLRAGATAAANAADSTAAAGPQTDHPGFAVAAGLGQAAADVPGGVLQSILHPIRAVDQLTGSAANIQRAQQVAGDPNADWKDRLDATLRATVFNTGYAPERALLEATGAKSDTPASLVDQAHAAGNVASLALLGAKPGPVLRVIRGGLRSTLGPILDRAAAGPRMPAPTAAVVGLTPKAAAALGARIAQPIGGPLEDIAAAHADLASGKISPQDFQTAMEMASRQVNMAPTGLLRAQQLPIRGDVAATMPATVPAGPPPMGLLPYYPRGGAVEQAATPFPATSPPMGNPGLPLAQLKLLLHLPPAQFEAAASMFPPEVMQQLRALRGGLLQPVMP